MLAAGRDDALQAGADDTFTIGDFVILPHLRRFYFASTRRCRALIDIR